MSAIPNTTPIPRGMPLLSGPPPLVESQECRQCARDFNALWRRPKACGHCGYAYCSSCMSNFQALMPRPVPDGPLAGMRALRGNPGTYTTQSMRYEPEAVCTGCIDLLQITAAPMNTMRGFPIRRLKDYVEAYDIQVQRVWEKEDLVQAVVKARDEATGCVPPEKESYYRRRIVPLRGKGRPNGSTASQRPFAQQQQQQSNRPPPPQQRPPPPQQRAQPRPPPPPPRQAPIPRPRPPPPRQSSPASKPARKAQPTPAAPVPTVLSLAALPQSYLSTLSVGTLKSILAENHVRVDYKQVREKDELISRVWELVSSERARLKRQRRAEERERAMQNPGYEQRRSHSFSSDESGDGSGDGTRSGSGTGAGAKPRTASTSADFDAERGLCIICQDEEATLAVVDCGHLTMCQPCSEVIMASSRECPMCRTRIVTSQRLIRIYRA